MNSAAAATDITDISESAADHSSSSLRSSLRAAVSVSSATYCSHPAQPSRLAHQPADHLIEINRFLTTKDTLALFRCNRRLYDIPLRYRVELFTPVVFLDLSRYGSQSGLIISNGQELSNFRFCFVSVRIFLEQSLQGIRAVCQLNTRIFTCLKRFSASVTSGSPFDFDWLQTLERLELQSRTSLRNASQISSPLPVMFPVLLRELILVNFEFAGHVSSLNYLSCLEKLDLPSTFDQPLSPDFFPSSLKWLNLGSAFNHPINPGSLPPRLESIKFGFSRPEGYSAFNQPLLPGSLPSSLETIRFSTDFDQPLLPGVLPASLRELTILGDSRFDEPLIPGALPPDLQTLKLGDAFNHPLIPGSLPASLKFLTLGEDFDHPIPPGSLPPGLESLEFVTDRSSESGAIFNRPLSLGSLPASLLTLTFSRFFDQPIKPGILPTGLRTLRFIMNFNHPLPPGVLPPSLTELSFAIGDFNQPLEPGSLPSNLRTLELGYSFSHPLFPNILPQSLRRLTIENVEFFPLPLSALFRELELLFDQQSSGTVKSHLHRQLNPSIVVSRNSSIGKIVQFRSDVASRMLPALGLTAESTFRCLDGCWEGLLIELINPENVGDSTVSTRYWVSLHHIEPVSWPTEVGTGKRKRVADD